MDHINRYLELFPRNSLFVALYDDLKADPHTFIRRIFEFLEVDGNYPPPSANLRINPMELEIKRSYGLHRLTQRMKGSLITRGVSTYIDRINTIHVSRADLPERHKPTREIRSQIRDIYADQNEKLGAFLGRDLSHWNRVD